MTNRYTDAEAVDNRPPDSPERLAAKAAARTAVAEARRKSAWTPPVEIPERRIQEPWPSEPQP